MSENKTRRPRSVPSLLGKHPRTEEQKVPVTLPQFMAKVKQVREGGLMVHAARDKVLADLGYASVKDAKETNGWEM